MQIQTARQPRRSEQQAGGLHGLRPIGAFMPEVLASHGIDPNELPDPERGTLLRLLQPANAAAAGIAESLTRA